ISGYGDDAERPGPYRDKKAYDLLIQSESGFVSITGTPDEPAKAGCSIADIAAGMYPYGPFPAGDGRIVMLGLQNEREWQVFCARVLERPELATDPRFASNAARTAARESLRAIIVETFAAMTAEQVVAR